MFPQRQTPAADGPSARWSVASTPVLLAQYAELLETVWACERAWRLEDRIDATVRYGTGR